jgi:hypothetical protein
MSKSKVQDLSVLETMLKDNVLALGLIDKAKFMEKTLQELQTKITENGVITEMCQGSYNIDRANPALNAYNITLKNYTSVVKQLNDMLPKTEKVNSKLEEFKNF